MTAPIADPIIERRLSVDGAHERVVLVTIGWPRRDPAGDWICSFGVDGLDGPQRGVAHGLDAFQALLHAVQGVRTQLDASGLLLTWEGGEPGDTGIPRMVPMFYGRAFAERIEKHIDQEVEAFAKAAALHSAKQP